MDSFSYIVCDLISNPYLMVLNNQGYWNDVDNKEAIIGQLHLSKCIQTFEFYFESEGLPVRYEHRLQRIY